MESEIVEALSEISYQLSLMNIVQTAGVCVIILSMVFICLKIK